MQESHYWTLLVSGFRSKEEQTDIQQKIQPLELVLGVEEFSMTEDQVDELLGERAYSGGDIPKAVLEEVDDRQDEVGKTQIKIYLGKEDDATVLTASLLDQFSHLSIEKNQHPIEDWTGYWREHYERIEVSERLAIVPEWEKANDATPLKSIYIYPGRGFGTGNHETTFLCLKLLDTLREKAELQTVFDLGCGSGILGIAAIKFFNSLIDFCDIDRAALENTLQNIEVNFTNHDLSGSTLVLRERYQPGKTYDLVFANILLHVLESERELIQNSVKPEGYLILSGVLREQEEELAKLYNKETGFELIESVHKGDWIAWLMRKY